MSQYPPSAGGPQQAGPPAGQRPGAVTAAAVLLFIAGGLAILGALVLMNVTEASLFKILAVIDLALAAAAIYAGVQVLNLKESGRKVGVVIAAIGIALNVLAITQSAATGILGVALYGFILYSLLQNAQYFRE